MNGSHYHRTFILHKQVKKSHWTGRHEFPLLLYCRRLCALVWNMLSGLFLFLSFDGYTLRSFVLLNKLIKTLKCSLSTSLLPLCLSIEFYIHWIGWVQEHGSLSSLGEETFMQTHWSQLEKSISGLAIEVRNFLGSREFGKRSNHQTWKLLTSIVLLTGCFLLTWTIIVLHFVTRDWRHADVLIKLSSKVLGKWNRGLSDHSPC